MQWTQATSTNQVNLFGEGLDAQVSGGVLQGLTGTQITQIHVVSDSLALNFAGMTYAVDEFFDLVLAKDWTGLAAYVRQGNDRIIGTKNDLTLLGGDGDDRFEAGLGRDLMNGGRGNDTVIATEGHDKMIGGRGDDVFEFVDTPYPDRWDIIQDFATGQDKIYLNDVSFNRVGSGGFDGAPLEAIHFGYGVRAKTADQGLIYDQAKGLLYYDGDGPVIRPGGWCVPNWAREPS